MRSHHEVLLLDFGGVCLLNPVELHDRTTRMLGLAPGTLDWLGPIDPSTDELWRDMTSGTGVTEREYWSIRAAEVGARVDRAMTVRDYMTMLYEPPSDEIVRPEALATVRVSQAAGIEVSILTNDMRAFHGPEWEYDVPLLQLVSHVVDCSDTDILKPDRRAYERALEIIGVDAHQVLFVDDQHVNVQGAIDAGLDAMWFDVANATASWASVRAALGVD